MEKHNEITTAANSKTMNSIGNSKLFAAAASQPEQSIDFTEAESITTNTDKATKKNAGKKNRKPEK
ncbi:MAG: hypothetical protein JWP81_176 [Ferruginibacter sp.]|nr:hypothetical protein [Ferruginibacter sp.]